VWVSGEVLDPLVSRRGHLYFRLRDDQGEIRAVMWRRDLQNARSVPRSGDFLTVRGSVDVYPARGDLQLQVAAFKLSGQGAKLLKIQELKRRLKSEGLFDRPRRPLPFFPARVGVVTSVGSAVIHDIYQSVQSRNPCCSLLLSPASVSGNRVAQEVEAALELLKGRVDVVIVARGGGSFEELLPFSEERLVRAAAAYPLPLVAAIGHGSDLSLLDLVADHTAPTPTAAAVLVTPDRLELKESVHRCRERLASHFHRKLRLEKERLKTARERCAQKHPLKQTANERRRVELYRRNLKSAVSRTVSEKRLRLQSVRKSLKPAHLQSRLERTRWGQERMRSRLLLTFQHNLSKTRARFEQVRNRLLGLDPATPLRKGFALVRAGEQVVTGIGGRTVGEELELQFADGSLDVVVKQVRVSTNPHD